jgi:uncharacterized repeat protein (TIGR03803 family)
MFRIASGTNQITRLGSLNSSEAAPIADAAGNLYGTTFGGGANNFGTVYKLDANTHTLSTVHSFSAAEGGTPEADLMMDSHGNLYGTAGQQGPGGYGTVFKISAGTNVLTTLATFTGPNGAYPNSTPVMAANGDIYAIAGAGGQFGNGAMIKIAAGTGSVTTVANFNGTNGANPTAKLVLGPNGHIYGTTANGGIGFTGQETGDGTVFDYNPGTGSLTTIVQFNGANGLEPSFYGGMILDGAGNLFGTTYQGGSFNKGTVFEISMSTNTLTTLFNFNGTNGNGPLGTLFADASGNLFGATAFGGTPTWGNVYELSGTGFVPTPEPGLLSILTVGGLCLVRRR